ncbi:MAG: 3-hydroxyacyl-ACP dehydratase FabZ [Deltaproteobacteria bacterium]|nr:3-hydroxyacyl-ACP dehydratase FabZ [Candidatus Anaeroferrophillacea bacterium]
MDIAKIMDYLPHRYPFLLVDRVLGVEPHRRITAVKNVTINEPFFIGHFPGFPVMPGVLIIEALAQAGGLLVLHSEGLELAHDLSRKVFFMGIDKARFRRPVVPGDVLRLEVSTIQRRGKIWKSHGEALVDGTPVAEADMMASIG